jgi:hypothetical protein
VRHMRPEAAECSEWVLGPELTPRALIPIVRRKWLPPMFDTPCTCKTDAIDSRFYASTCLNGDIGPGDSCTILCADAPDGVTNQVPATCGANGVYVGYT